jgi:hypothetical protein
MRMPQVWHGHSHCDERRRAAPVPREMLWRLPEKKGRCPERASIVSTIGILDREQTIV